MSGKKHGSIRGSGGDKKTRDKVNRDNPRGKKHGGRKRDQKKLSPMVKFISINKDQIYNDEDKQRDWRKIRLV